MEIEGFSFQAPAGFRTEDVTMGLRFGLPGSGPGPSMVVQSKPARANVTLVDLASETLGELAQTVPGMRNASKSELTFEDGGAGMLLAYTFTAHSGELRQYFALRLEQGRVCTVALTVPAVNLTEQSAKTFLTAIASVKPR